LSTAIIRPVSAVQSGGGQSWSSTDSGDPRSAIAIDIAFVRGDTGRCSNIDIGYDLPLDYVRPYVHPDGIRLCTGLKYYRITSRHSDWKEPHDPEAAWSKAAEHAGNFMFNRERQVEYVAGCMNRKPIIVAPYDAELFGHWWYEGPHFLEMLFRKLRYDQRTIRPVLPSEYLSEYPNLCDLTCSSTTRVRNAALRFLAEMAQIASLPT
jgi:predicted glycosyl hydrolase (DUF1957 family)